MNSTVIDSSEFCRLQQALSGEVAVADLARLRAELADGEGSLRWSIAGGRHEVGAPQLLMQVAGEVRLVCQRCLKPYAFAVDTHTVLVLAKDEGEADELEARMDDEGADVIVADKEQDVLALVEDDALLALPLSPRHEACPGGPALEVASAKAESPFSVLQKLKQ